MSDRRKMLLAQIEAIKENIEEAEGQISGGWFSKAYEPVRVATVLSEGLLKIVKGYRK